jgi:hypothetical protein
VAHALAIGLLYAIPLAIAWNLAAERIAPSLVLQLGQLTGVTAAPAPASWSWRSFADGTLQATVARAVGAAAPLRPFLIRLNNEIRYTLFGAIAAPDIIEGDSHQLIERYAWEEYCSRNPETAAHKAREIIPKLRDIQDYYAARNRVFLYIITPSKAAHLPEYFLPRFPCGNSPEDRTTKLPALVGLLRQAGIHVLDTASLIHALKGTERVDLFARGSIHWNSLANAHAADAVVAEIDRLDTGAAIPRLHWRYEVVNRAHGADSDLAELMNLLVPRVHYPAPAVTQLPAPPCDAQTSSRLDVALVGNSFSEGLAEALISGACLSRLTIYRYLEIRHGATAESWKLTPLESDIAPIRDADVVILEENEGFVAEGSYVARLRALVAGR